jgi:hypothetical protein
LILILARKGENKENQSLGQLDARVGVEFQVYPNGLCSPFTGVVAFNIHSHTKSRTFTSISIYADALCTDAEIEPARDQQPTCRLQSSTPQ